MSMEKRTNPRLKEYDYSQQGAYFITVCSKDKKHIFGRIIHPATDNANPVGRDDPGAPCTKLSPIGAVVEKYILSVDTAYKNISVDKYVVMPNHIHLLLTISAQGAPGSSRPTVSQVISAFKRFTNKDTGLKLWQSSFYDHIIRDENDYLTRWNYIDTNPARWVDDEYYAP